MNLLLKVLSITLLITTTYWHIALGQHGHHGMVMFGDSGEVKPTPENIDSFAVYISHLPLLRGTHTTHAGQHVSEVEMPADQKLSYLLDRYNNRDIALYSAAPMETFDRNRFAELGFSFSVRIFRNHFENPPEFPPAQPLAQAFAFKIKRVIVNKELSTTPAFKDPSPEFSFFGNATQMFAVRNFQSAPDVQLIYEIELDGNTPWENDEIVTMPLGGFTIPQTINPREFQLGFKGPEVGKQLTPNAPIAIFPVIKVKRILFTNFRDLRG